VFSSTTPPDQQITLESESAAVDAKPKKRTPPSQPVAPPKASGASIGLDKRDPWADN
jgi:hypothetical protein